LRSYTIDHFKSKTRYPEEAYHWLNLYLCCRQCQEKDENYCEELLRPDEAGYRFERYFIYNYQTGEIGVNPSAVDEDQHRAQLTINYLKLNKHPRPMARRNFWERFRRYSREAQSAFLPDAPFRFILTDEFPPEHHA